MRYGLLSADYLVDRVRRDTRMPDYNFRPDDLREWIAEAVRGLSACGQFDEKKVQLRYENYRCSLPTDWAGYKCTCSSFTRHYTDLVFQKAQGVATITYYVMPVDTSGVPMLIDEPNVLNYVHWFVMEKLCYLGDLPAAFTVQDCFVKKMDALRCAQTNLNWPTHKGSRNFKTR